MKSKDEVIKALRCCWVNEDEPCEDNCPYCGEEDCVGEVMADALKLLEG